MAPCHGNVPLVVNLDRYFIYHIYSSLNEIFPPNQHGGKNALSWIQVPAEAGSSSSLGLDGSFVRGWDTQLGDFRGNHGVAGAMGETCLCGSGGG